MNPNHKENLQAEFREFLERDTSGLTAPEALLTQIKGYLFPDPWAVFAKIALIHAVVGLLSLAVCHQFGLNPFEMDASLSHWFMNIGGQEVCMSLCGVFFIGTTYFFSNFFLTFEELESIKHHLWLQCGIISLVSLAAFYFFGVDLAALMAFFWLAGAIVGGVGSVKSSYYIRRALLS